ncbi:MAG: glycosyltransferase family 4 protein [Lachnospiraceae bacterium]|nr:glycosyltransferase family 4 protein [Lachnospiraceae bacterium]
MSKIVFFSGGIDRYGGTERVLSIVSSQLSRRGHEVIIVSMCGECKSHYPLDENIRLIFMQAKGFAKGITANLSKLGKIIEEEKPDFWIDVDIILGLYTGLVRKKHRGMKWISWEHFNYYTVFPYYKKLRAYTRKMVCKKSDCLVVLSKEDEGYYRANEKIRHKLISIHNPSPYEICIPKGNKKKIILAAGRLLKIKGYDMLAEAWGLICEKYPDWNLVIAGEGEERENIENIIQEKNIKNISLPGFVENMPEMYKESSMFVLSSRNEGFVMVLLEAMSFGLPCVGFGCKAGVKEIIADGETGYIAEPENISDLAAKMELLINDEEIRDQMSQKAIESVKRFDINVITDQWEDLFKSLV